MAEKKSTYTLDIDVGGTFTDGFFTDGSQNRTAKVLTTPHDITEGFMDCVRMGSGLFDIELDDFLRRTKVARLSTTVGTNLLVQRKGARIGLLVTKGCEQSLYGTASTADILKDIVAPEMVRGINEKVDETGQSVLQPDQSEVLAAVRELIHEGAEIIVASLMNAWRNPENELQIRSIIRERYPTHYLRSVPVQLGSEIIQHRDDHARTNSAVLNAYIHSDMARALFRAEDKIRAAGYSKPLLIVHASGGNARVAKTVALNTLHSGPAVAVKGAAVLANTLGLDHVVSADMGGTSFDIGLVVNREAKLDKEPRIESMPIATPTINVESTGIGGGSIAWLDEDKQLRVGPESASSAPGPAAYGKGGTEPTVSDANVVLGFIDPDNFLGGRMKLDLDAARRVIERRIARKLKITVEEAAFDIRKIANQHMADEISKRLARATVDPGNVSLLAVGGAGPLHTCDIAAIAGLKGGIALSFGSVFSAFGGSQTDVQHLYNHTFVNPSTCAQARGAALQRLVAQATRDMQGEGIAADSIAYHVRAVGDGGSTQVSSNMAETDQLTDELNRLAGTTPIDAIEVVAEGAVPHWQLRSAPLTHSATTPTSVRPVYWTRVAATETPFFDLRQLKPGNKIVGPAIIDGTDTTYAVSPGWELNVDEFGCFRCARCAGPDDMAGVRAQVDMET